MGQNSIQCLHTYHTCIRWWGGGGGIDGRQPHHKKILTEEEGEGEEENVCILRDFEIIFVIGT